MHHDKTQQRRNGNDVIVKINDVIALYNVTRAMLYLVLELLMNTYICFHYFTYQRQDRKCHFFSCYCIEKYPCIICCSFHSM